MNSIQQLVRKNILALQAYTSARDLFTGAEGVFLDANENPNGSLNRYPDPYQKDVKKSIAKLKNIAEDQVFIGNGSDEILDLAFRIFCEPNEDKVLSFNPSYGMYEVLANIHGVEWISLPLNATFQPDISILSPYLLDAKLKMIILCSPNNPTGNLIDVETIDLILNKFKGIVIIDEAYIDFSKQASFIQQLANYPNLIVSQTLSKAWGMAALRLGIAFMNQNIIAYFNKVKAPYNISGLTQSTVVEKLQEVAKFKQEVAMLIEERDLLSKALMDIKMIKRVYPSDANFLLVEVDNADTLYTQLLNKQIIVRNRNSMVKNCIRITVGSPTENKQLLNTLKELDHA